MKIAVTGHRPERLRGKEKEIYEWFKKKFAAARPEEIITGMAQGTDQIAAQVARDLGIPYVCVYAYRKTHSPQEQDLIDSSAGVIYYADKYYKDCYLHRDELMVDLADEVLAVWDGKEGGGTSYTMNYALKNNKLKNIFRIKASK